MAGTDVVDRTYGRVAGPRPYAAGSGWRISAAALNLAMALVTAAGFFVVAGREAAANVLLVWVVVSCLWFSVRRFETALTIYVFAIPFEQIFSGWGAGRWNSLTYLLAAMLVLNVLASQRIRMPRPGMAELFFLGWISWSAITLFWSPATFTGGAATIVTLAGGLLVLAAFHWHTGSDQAVGRWLWYFISAQLVVTIIQTIYYQPFTGSYWNEVSQRWQPSMLGLGEGLSAVQFGRAALVASIAALALWEVERKPRRKRLALALAGLFGMAAFLTSIRATMLALTIAVLVWAYLGRGRTGRGAKTAIAGVTLAIVLAGAWLVNAEAMTVRWDQTFGFYSQGHWKAMTSGRSFIWAIGWDMVQARPILGVGFGAFAMAFSQWTGARGLDGHNAYLTALAETGVIGLFLFAGMIVSLGLLAARTGPLRHVALAWWAGFAVVLFFSGVGQSKGFWFVFGLLPYLSSRNAARRTCPSKGAAPTASGTERFEEQQA